MRHCWGITRTLHRCGRRGDWAWFCDEHKRQPAAAAFAFVFTVLAGTASIYSAWFTVPKTTAGTRPPDSHSTMGGVDHGDFKLIVRTERPLIRIDSIVVPLTLSNVGSGTWQAVEARIAFDHMWSIGAPLTVSPVPVALGHTPIRAGDAISLRVAVGSLHVLMALFCGVPNKVTLSVSLLDPALQNESMLRVVPVAVVPERRAGPVPPQSGRSVYSWSEITYGFYSGGGERDVSAGWSLLDVDSAQVARAIPARARRMCGQ